MKLSYLFLVLPLLPLSVAAQSSTNTPLTFQSSPIRLNTRPIFAKKSPTPSVEEKKETAKPVTNWRTTGEYRIADHFVAGDWQRINGSTFAETTGGQSRLRLAQTDRPGIYAIDMPYDFKQNDFVIEVVVEERAISPLAGLVYGLADKDNYYSFLINPKGEYQIDGMLEGESLGVMPRFVKSPTIRAKGPNTLKIDKKGNQVRYLINGQKVHESRFINFAGGKIGYYTQSQEVSFKDFSVNLLK